MPHVPGKRRSSAQNVACRASMAAINSQKKDKENLNPSNSDDLDTVSRSLYSTTVNKLIAVKKKLHNVSRKLGHSWPKIWVLETSYLVLNTTELIIMHISTYNSFLQLNLIIILVYTNYITTIHTSYTVSNCVLRGWWLVRRKFRAVTITSRDLARQHLHAKLGSVASTQ